MIKRTSTFFCRHCDHVLRIHHNILFDAAADPLCRVLIMLHAITHHKALLTFRARRMAPAWFVIYTVAFIILELLDVLHTVLWAVTWPFWWLHEEVL